MLFLICLSSNGVSVCRLAILDCLFTFYNAYWYKQSPQPQLPDTFATTLFIILIFCNAHLLYWCQKHSKYCFISRHMNDVDNITNKNKTLKYCPCIWTRSITFTDISSFFFVLLLFKFLLVSNFVCISRLSILVFSIVYMYCTGQKHRTKSNKTKTHYRKYPPFIL
jgi:hypothetical protein